MKSVIYIFCFSLAINIQAAHPCAEEIFYQPMIERLINPLCVLEEELNPLLNPDFTKNHYQVEEDTWRTLIKREENQTKESLECFCNIVSLMIQARELAASTPNVSSESIPNSSIGYENSSSELNCSSLQRSFSLVEKTNRNAT